MHTDELGTPIQWERKWHPVERVDGRWRVDKRWWQERIWREYFQLTTEMGMLVVVYRDFVGRKWSLQRVYD